MTKRTEKYFFAIWTWMSSHLSHSLRSLASRTHTGLVSYRIQFFFFVLVLTSSWFELRISWCVVTPWQLPCCLCISLLLLWRGLRQDLGLVRFSSATDSDFTAIWHVGAGVAQLTLWLHVPWLGTFDLCPFKVMTLDSFPSSSHSDSRVKFTWYPCKCYLKVPCFWNHPSQLWYSGFCYNPTLSI